MAPQRQVIDVVPELDGPANGPVQPPNGEELLHQERDILHALEVPPPAEPEVELDSLSGLVAAANYQQDLTETIEIARGGRLLFRFRIMPLPETAYDDCRERATRYQRSRSMGGLKLPEETDAPRFRCMLIYNATVPADRVTLWDNREAWTKVKAMNNFDLIEKVLMAGEKNAVVDRIDRLSGYGSEMGLEDTVKN